MKKAMLAFALLVAAAVFLSGCPAPPEPVTASGGDGTSFEKAVFITETNEYDGIAAEYAWLDAKGCAQNGGMDDMELQELANYNGKRYDILYAVCKDGAKIEYYFDISNFFGKLK